MGPFFGKRLASIGTDDLKRLVDDAVPESRHLDYKQSLSLETNDEKNEFLRDVTAFANAGGGTILFGIEEQRDPDGKPTGIPKDLAGFAVPNPDDFILRIEHLLKNGIDERLPSFEISLPKPVESIAKTFLAMRIPSSIRGPHMVTLGGDRRFYMRHNAGKQDMSTAQVRDGVLKTANIEERINLLVKTRCAKWRESLKGPFSILHIIPILRLPVAIDVTSNTLIHRLLYQDKVLTGSDHLHCIEGFKAWSSVAGDKRIHQTVFRDGSLEYLDQRYFTDEEKVVACVVLDGEIFDCLEGALKLYKDNTLQLPAAVCLTLCGVQGYRMPIPDGVPRGRLAENDLFAEPIILSEIPTDLKREIRPTFDFIWNAFGYRNCPAYDDSGLYRGYSRYR